MPAPEIIHRLIDQFKRNRATYTSQKYNETLLRQEFLNPFFKALGWDIDNEKGFALQYREVIHEDRVDVDGSTKAPDYAFRIGGVRKFFVEAKKPAEDIEGDANLAYQLRRYAWNAHLPISILTDFEEFAVYDCRNKPNPGDSPATSRIMLLRYEDYVERWDEIAAVFSPEAILMGAFDRYAEDNTGKRGTIKVDDAFLADIEEWRTLLARNIALRNPQVADERQLNFAVQMIIDRIIFLRICEDRKIEPGNQLQEISQQEGVYPALVALFERADLRYNSGLFHFKKEKRRSDSVDALTPTLAVDDKVLKEIIKDLYFPSPYIFNEIPVEILGQVYEQFLGKVIRLTAGHRAKVEEKPEVRKAGGVYYTPKYIVDYIVEHTVGKLLEGKTPKEAAKLKIVDPACGSGSFLLGAFQRLLDWHEQWYLEHDPAKWAQGADAALSPSEDGGWRLSTAEKKRILLNNIFGVDIDAQAVEVTKLSLLLKVLEGETGQLSLGFERVLPDLGANIQCGNSLIGPDYYEGKQLGLFNADEMYRINAFDWERAFPAVFAQGGFDAVIGNPPYGAEFLQILQDFLKSKYQTFIWRGESYLLFIEKALDLLRTGGQFSFIIPDTYLNLGFTKILRKLILNTSKVDEIVVLPSNVFAGATVDTTLLFFEKANHTNDYYERDVHVVLHDKKAVIHDVNDPPRKNFVISSKVWWDHGVFMVHSNSKEVKIIEKMEDGNEDLGNIADVFYGIKVYQVGKGKPPQTKDTLKEKPFTSKHKKEGFLPFYNGKNVERYFLNWESNNWIKYGEWVAEPRNPEKFYGEKILMRKIVGKTIISTYVPETSYCNTLLYVIKVNEENSHIDHKYLLGILNSSLFGWYFRMKLQIDETDIFPQILKGNIDKLPINTKADNKKYIIDRVDQMLNLNSQFRVLKTPTEKTQLQRQIDATDAEIDRLVYELYGLTDEEIRIVEESVK